ncbi:FecR family protein [Flavobacteriaceae bacterium SZ-1-7]|uniref:FecR family protein n=1 Tax=Tamlana sedimenti TaxID=3134126 RepID=UPI003125B16D
MDKDYLNKKWLAGDLTEEEGKAFELIEDNELLKKIVDEAPVFSVSHFSKAKDFDELKPQIDAKKHLKKKHNWLNPMLKIASVLVVGFAVYFLLFSNNTVSIETAAAEKRLVQLPDASQVTLNAASEIEYDEKTWADKRSVTLEGEAFFKVAKGSNFDVNTAVGKVTVVGTRFNVKNRKNLFEVSCFEGQVLLTYGKEKWAVLPGNMYRIINGEVTTDIVDAGSKPLWLSNASYFKKVPFSEVVQELERQYNVEISVDENTANQLFTGGFNHYNLKEALKSITLPLKLKFVMDSSSKISLHQIE